MVPLTPTIDEIHSLGKSGAHEDVLRALLSDSGSIKDEYSGDLNHAWYLVGDSLYELERYPEALRAFRCSFRSDSTDHLALMGMANSASEMKMPRRAVRYLRMAISRAPDDRNIQGNLGNAFFDAEDYVSAMRAYSKVRGHDSLAGMARRNSKRAARLNRSRPER